MWSTFWEPMRGAVLCVLLVWSAVSGPSAETDSTTFRTVLRGMADREQRVDSIAGEATVRTFYTDWRWRALQQAIAEVAGEEDAREFAQEDHPAKEMAFLEFRVGRGLWRVERQYLYRGGSRTDGDDGGVLKLGGAHFLEVCDGAHVFRLWGGEAPYPRVEIGRRADARAALFRSPVGEYAGLSYLGRAFSEKLRAATEDPLYRLGNVRWADESTIYFEMATIRPDIAEEDRFWVDTRAGFALRRFERLAMVPDRPDHGGAHVLVWDDFVLAEPAGVWLPSSYRHEQFQYVPDGASSHQSTTLVALTITGVNENVSIDAPAWLPSGARLELEGSVDDAALRQLAGHSRQLWSQAHPFATAETIPPPDPQAPRPLSPTALRKLRVKYGFGQTP